MHYKCVVKMGIVGWLELQLDQGSEWKWQVK